MHASSPTVSWTFADQVSSYRFWALLGAWLLVALNHHMLTQGVLQTAHEQLGSYAGIAPLMGVAMPLGIVAGIVGGMLVVRGHTVRWLIAAALLCGVVQPLVTWASGDPTLITLGLDLLAGVALSYSFMLAVTAVVASGRGGSVAFAAVLAVVLLLKAGVEMLAAYARIALGQHWPDVNPQAWGIAVVSVAVLLLLPLLHPVAHPLFSGAPAERHRPLTPHYRHPLVAAVWSVLLLAGVLAALYLLWHAQFWVYAQEVHPVWIKLAGAVALVGLLGVVHWNYRIHGEIAALVPSAQLLTPHAAAVATLLLPLGALLLPLQLASVLNQTQRGRVSVGWLVAWSLLLPPVAVAQVQHAVNRVTAAAGLPVAQ